MVETKLKFDESFFKEEEKCGFYITKKRKEVWAIELDLLYYFDQVCKKYNLTYYLYGGTLLGAVRHKGFIPWDDDVDVVMLRKDYNKLIEISAREFHHPYFFQHAYTETGGYHRGHIQIRNTNTCGALEEEFLTVKFNQGIFIDVFVLDKIPDNENELQKHEQELMYYGSLMRRITNKTYMKPLTVNLGNNIETKYIKYENLMHIYRLFDTQVSKYENENTARVGQVAFFTSLSMNMPETVKFSIDWFKRTENIEFENLMFTIPSNSKALLKAYYGDNYMTPMQSPNSHGKVIFDTEKSYLDILSNIYL